MDPISIISATISIGNNGAYLLKSIISQTTNVDRDLQQLHREITLLNGILVSIRRLFGNELETGHIGTLKKQVIDAVKDCQVTLRDLDGLLLEIDSRRQGFMGRPMAAGIKSYRSSDIDYFQRNIGSCTRGLNLALSALSA